MSRHFGVISVFLVLGLVLGSLPAAALPTPIGEQIVNGGFQNGRGAPSLAHWETSGTVKARRPNNPINTSGGNAGFDQFFDSPFAVLGDSGGRIGGAPKQGVSTISQTITLPGVIGDLEVLSYDLTISFRTVFDGDDSFGSSHKDFFSAYLNDIGLFSQSSDPMPNIGPSVFLIDRQIENDPFLASILGLTPGLYTLSFILDEASGWWLNAGNTAAGIDDVSVTGLANYHVDALTNYKVADSPPIANPEPATMLLLGSGLLGIGLRARRRIRK